MKRLQSHLKNFNQSQLEFETKQPELARDQTNHVRAGCPFAVGTDDFHWLMIMNKFRCQEQSCKPTEKILFEIVLW